ncbi:MAG: transcription termination/antitermination factor NusG [Actinobacteria bacterium]|nr:transcription termination/antitermination factor NusG [Actinomycetota bacterium]
MTADRDVAEAPAAEVPSEAKWYVINTYSGYEAKVRENLLHRITTMEANDRVFCVVVPTEEVEEVRHGQRRKVQRKMYPGYVLVQMLLDDNSWMVVRNTPGVVNFVGSGNKPTPLPPEEAETIFRQMEGEAPRPEVRIQVGERVKIVDGPFSDFFGTVDQVMDDKQRLRVLVSFFGRETPVELDFLQVEKQSGGSAAPTGA